MANRTHGYAKPGPDTIFALASITKTVTSVALMQLYEAGLLSLDVDVSIYLPFRVTHPQHGAAPITLRSLMSHTAAIADTTVWMSSDRLGSGLGSHRRYIESMIRRRFIVGNSTFV